MALEKFPNGFEKILYDEQIPRVVEELQRRSISFSSSISSGSIFINRLVDTSQTLGDLISFSGSAWGRFGIGPENSILSVYSGLPTYRTLAASGGVVLNTSPGHLSFSLSSNLNALGAMDSSPGYLVQTGVSSFAKRTLVAGTGLNITNTTGGGNPSFSLADTSVGAGSYGTSTLIPSFTVDAQGRLTAASSLAVSVSGAGGLMGAGSLYQLAYFTGTHTVTGDNGLTYNNSTGLNLSSTLTVGGDLIINGSLTSINSASLSVEDTLVKFGNNNPSDITDLGFYGQYNYVGTDKYTGLFRDATDGWYKLFTGLEDEPSTTVNIGGTGFGRANLEVGDLNAYNTTFGHTTINSTVNVSGTSYLAGARFTGNVGIQSGEPLQPLVVGGGNGTDTSLEVSIGSNAFVQAYNRNTFSYSDLYFDASTIVFRPNGSTKFSIGSSSSIFSNTLYSNGSTYLNNSGLLIADTANYSPTAAGEFAIVTGYSSPTKARFFIGDGSGWKLGFAKRTASTTTDVLTIKDNGTINTTGAYVQSGVQTNFFTGVTYFMDAAISNRSNSSDRAFAAILPGDTQYRYDLRANGTMYMSDGSSSADTYIARKSNGGLYLCRLAGSSGGTSNIMEFLGYGGYGVKFSINEAASTTLTATASANAYHYTTSDDVTGLVGASKPYSGYYVGSTSNHPLNLIQNNSVKAYFSGNYLTNYTGYTQTGSYANTFTGDSSFSGALTTNTAAIGTNTTQVATTAFVTQAIASSTVSTSGQFFIQGGNSFGTTARVGTANHDALQIATSGHARIHITKDGLVGVGTTNPATNFVVGSSTTAGMEISLSSGITLQAYNRNIFDYATFNFDGAAMNFRPNGSQKMGIDSTGQLTLPGAGSGAGILVGGDVQWYRDSANMWRTPDSVTVDSPIYGPTAPTGAATLQLATTAFVTQATSGLSTKLAPNVMLVGGYTPTVSGIDAVKWIVPFHPTTGAALTYGIKRIDLRVETPGSTSARVNVMKSTGNGAFSGTLLLTNNMWVGNTTRETSGITPHFAVSTITSGDKLATYFENIGGGVGEFTVQVQLLEQ